MDKSYFKRYVVWQDLQLSAVSLKAVITESRSPNLAAFASEIVASQLKSAAAVKPLKFSQIFGDASEGFIPLPAGK